VAKKYHALERRGRTRHLLYCHRLLMTLSSGLSRRMKLKAVSLFSQQSSLICRLNSLLREINSLFG
jgi:hypothetical protein